MPPPKVQADMAEMQLRRASAEMERQLYGGKPCCAEDLLAAYPLVADDEECAIDLMYTEFVLRQRLGQQPDENQWYSRFPQHQEQLRRVFRFHELLEGSQPPNTTNVSQHTPAPNDEVFLLSASPRRLGQYDLLDEIGRGGMGVVYRARQRRLDRLVAVKMILTGALASQEELARFQTEARAAAALKHPNIVQVYEVGEEEGQPYLAMEYVEGIGLEKRLSGDLLAAHEIAQLIETLAHTMQHAHEHGIVHRDLKPANILLGKAEGRRQKAEGETDSFCLLPSAFCLPKITDFGLAKRLDVAEGPTRTNAILGTPSYMAPEQTEKGRTDLGPAADIYALGAILYECLTGRPPFKGEGVMDTLLQVRYQEPVPPSRLRPNVPRDLETICLKCLQKEPAKRYASALALAEDLAAWREGRPIRARPTPAWERGVKWARRRPAGAGLLAMSVLALAAVMVGTFLYIGTLQLEVEKSQLEVETSRLEVEKSRQYERAEGFQKKGFEILKKMPMRISSAGLMLIPGYGTVAKEILEEVLEYQKGFLDQAASTVEVRVQIGEVYDQLATIYQMLGRDREAEQTLRQGVAHFERLVAEHPTQQDCKFWLASNLYGLAGVLAQQPNSRKEAEETYHLALAHQQELVAADPRERRYLKNLANHYHGLGILLHRGGDYSGAEQNHRAALRLREKLTGEGIKEGHERYDQALSHLELALLRIEQKELAEADTHFREALRLLHSLVKDAPQMPDYTAQLAKALNNRGNLLLKMMKSAEAEAHYRQALALRERLHKEYLERPEYRNQLAITQMQLGNLLLLKAETQHEAEMLFRQALEHRQTLASVHSKMTENHHTLGMVYHKLAEVALRRQRPAEAGELLLHAIHHQREAVHAGRHPLASKALASHRRFLNGMLASSLTAITGW